MITIDEQSRILFVNPAADRDTGKRHFAWEAVELTGLHKSGRRFPIEVSFAEGVADGQRFFTGVVRLGGRSIRS